MAPSSTRIVVSDTSVLVNFLHLERLDLLARLSGYSFHVSEHVVAEVTRPEQVAALKQALANNWLYLATMTDEAEIARYRALLRIMDDGEAASLAIAEARGWLVACDEKKRFRREAEASIGAGRIVNTISLLVLAILNGLITVEEADAFKERLAELRFRIRVASFADLLPNRRHDGV